MSDFCAFNSDLFTKKIKDYSLEKNAVNSKSTIFKGTFTPLQLTCAVRIEKTDDFDVDMYKNELYINGLTKHPNILKMFSNFLHESQTWYTVFPYSTHKSLDLLCRPFGLPESVIAFVMEDVLKGIDYLHRNNIIHRFYFYYTEFYKIVLNASFYSAVQCSHILIFGDLMHSAKFVLTGLKYSYDMSKQSELQSYEYPKNAPKLLKYLASEVLEQNIIGYNFKSDIYSVGLACCELANGIAPFGDMQPDQLLFYKIIGDTPGPFDSTCEEMKIIREYTDKMEITLQRRYAHYMKRIFSPNFHHFVSNACLHIEQSRRYTTTELLEHLFILSSLEKYSSEKMHLLHQHLNAQL